MKKQTKENYNKWLTTIVVILMVLGLGSLLYFLVESMVRNEICLAERLCWDNGFEYRDWFSDKVSCYEINEKGDNLLIEFINVNWDKLNERFVCK